MILMNSAVDFIKKIKKTDGVVIIFHNDSDGICACAILMKLFEKLGLRQPYIISQPMPTDKNLLKRIQTSVPDKIIFLDLAIDQQQAVLKKLRGICDLLIIDHHVVFRNMGYGNITHLNPRIINRNVYQSASYITYGLCSRMKNMSDSLWIAAVGAIADYNINDSMDLMDEVREKYPEIFKDHAIPYDTYLGRIGDMLAAAKGTKALTCEQMVEMLRKAEKPEDIEHVKNSEKLIDAYRTIQNEIMHMLTDFEANAEKIKNMMLYQVKSKYNIGSIISTRISEKHPEKIIIIYEKSKGKVKFSGRNQSGINVGRILQKACKDLDSSAGGHDAAAGATIKEKDFEKFRENLIKVL
jgi:single-stranded DNA-specific DHH superfamily exonuclease